MTGICHIGAFLSLDTAILIGVCIVATRLDYCNSLLYGTSNRNLDKLQHIQSLLARNASWSDNATVVTRCLHWLPTRQRTQFKMELLGFTRCCCLHISNTFSPVIILPGSLGPLQFISRSNQQLILTLHHEPSLCRLRLFGTRSNPTSAPLILLHPSRHPGYALWKMTSSH